MILAFIFLATPAISVPDFGSTGLLLGLGILSLGVAARICKNQKR